MTSSSKTLCWPVCDCKLSREIFFQPYPKPNFRSVKFPCNAVTVKHNPLESEFYAGQEYLTDPPLPRSWVVTDLLSFIL